MSAARSCWASGALLTLNGERQLRLRPERGVRGARTTATSATDSFTYTVSDGQGGSDSATVTITVDGVTDIVPNVPPVAVDDAGSTDEDSALTSGNVLGNDSDGDGGTLWVTAVNGVAANVGSPIVLASGALLTLNGERQLRLRPERGVRGLERRRRAPPTASPTRCPTARAGATCATVTITVDGVTDIVPNVPPVAVDDAGSTDEDSALRRATCWATTATRDGGTLTRDGGERELPRMSAPRSCWPPGRF